VNQIKMESSGIPAPTPAPTDTSNEQTTAETSQQRLPLLMPISRLQAIVQVSDRYKPLFMQLLQIYQEMFNSTNKQLLFDLQPLAMYVNPEKGEAFKRVVDDIRNHYNVMVKTTLDCSKRLTFLKKNVFTTPEDVSIINDAIELLNLPNSSEITSDADFKLLSLQQKAKDADTAIEVQEIFLYLNSLFQPMDEYEEEREREKEKSRDRRDRDRDRDRKSRNR
jgi:hypothetical protein